MRVSRAVSCWMAGSKSGKSSPTKASAFHHSSTVTTTAAAVTVPSTVAYSRWAWGGPRSRARV
jgi:hypothetical protein